MPSGPPGALTKGQAWALALAATFTMAVSYVDRQTLAVLAPTVCEALAISEQDYGLLVSAFSLAYLVGSPLAGKLIDRVGARRGLLGAVLVWSAVAALHAVVPGFGVLFAMRIALGLSESPSFPGAAQTVHRALPPAERARGFGVLFTGSSFGAMLAPPLATAVNARFGWRVAFLVTAVVGLCWVPVWIYVAYSSASRRALDAAPEAPKVEAPPDAVPARGYRETGRAPVLPGWRGHLLFHPAVLRAILVVFACAPCISFPLNWGAKYLVRVHHLTQTEIGSYLWLPPVFFDLGAVLIGHLATSRARRLQEGSPPRGLLAVAMVLCATLAFGPWAQGPWQAVLICSVALAGGGGLFALLTADMMNRVPPASVSTAGGISAAAQSLAYIIANPLFGWVVQRTGSYDAILFWVGLWVLPGCIVWLLWKPPPMTSSERAA